MSNRDPDLRYDRLSQLLPFFFRQAMKDVATAIPGLIQSYDPATRRARVLPAINRILTDGRSLQRPVIVDVPVIFPSGGQFILHFPLQPNDAVMLIFSERGIQNFKESFTRQDATPGAMFEERDAVAFPGFGSASGVEIADTDNLCLQADDGEERIVIKENTIQIFVDATDGEILIGGENGEELVTKTFLSTYYNAHTHPTSMGGPTGPPLISAPMTAGADITKKQKSE